MKAVVTGAGAGLGASIAERLASEGYAVALLDQDGNAASRRAEELTGASAFQVDVSNPEQVADVFSRIGAVDLLVNNAGIARFGPLLEQSPADMQAVINVNLMGTALCAQQAAKQMAEQGAGCIINLSSINAVTPGPNVGLYAATKAAVHNLTILQA